MPKVIVITGASSGISAAPRSAGRGSRRELASSRDRDGLEERDARSRRAACQRRCLLPPTSSDAAAVEAAAAATKEALGRSTSDQRRDDDRVRLLPGRDPEKFQRATDVTYHGSVWGMQAALRRMVPRDRGTIVQVGLGDGLPGHPASGALLRRQARAARVFESLRTELRHKGSGVRLTTVHLRGSTRRSSSTVATSSTALAAGPPVYQPEVAADAIHRAAHRRRREVYVGIPTVYTIWATRSLRRSPSATSRGPRRVQLSDVHIFARPPGQCSKRRPGSGAHGAPTTAGAEAAPAVLVTKHRRALSAAVAGSGVAGASPRALADEGAGRNRADAGASRRRVPRRSRDALLAEQDARASATGELLPPAAR